MTMQFPVRNACCVLGLTFLATFRAVAGDASPEWLELVSPASTVEIGVGLVRGGTPSFRDATGIDPDVHRLIGNFDLRGGAAYHSPDTLRWRLTGNQLGQENREIRADYAQQGSYRIVFGIDQMPRSAAENYRTPFLGTGSAALTLPTGLAQASANPQTGAARLEANMRPFAIGTMRQHADLGGSFWLSPQLAFRVPLREEKQSGTRATGGAIGTIIPPASVVGMILPEPVRTNTRQIEASLGYQNPGSHLQVAYRGSFFRDEIDGFTFENPFNGLNTLLRNRIGTTPDNHAHQLSLNGGYSLGPKARLTASAAYGRLTQNESFLPYSTAAGSPALPRDSLDGLVVTRQLQLKLASRPLRDLRLNASYKSDSRDNRTPVASYNSPGVGAGGEVGTSRTLNNTPHSRDTKLGQVEAGYALRAGTDLNLMAQRETVARYCHGAPDCVEVPQTHEDTSRFEWRQDFAPGITARIGVTEAMRRGNDYRRYAESVELAGMRKFFLADRRRVQLRTGLNAEITDGLTLGLALDANRDRYERSPYGLQAADSHTVNLDLGYAFNDEVSLSAFITRESIASRLANGFSISAPGGVALEVPNGKWQAHMDDDVGTVGLTIKHKSLRSGQLEVEGNLVMVRSRSPYQIVGGINSASFPAVLPPQPLPVVTSQSLELRFGARLALDNTSALRFAYLYRRLASRDYGLDLYSIATLDRLLGTDEVSPRYKAHALGISYLHRFN